MSVPHYPENLFSRGAIGVAVVATPDRIAAEVSSGKRARLACRWVPASDGRLPMTWRGRRPSIRDADAKLAPKALGLARRLDFEKAVGARPNDRTSFRD